MSKAKQSHDPKGFKPFRLADGKTRQLPDWADKPLGFVCDPDEALRQGVRSKPAKGWGKTVITGRKSSR